MSISKKLSFKANHKKVYRIWKPARRQAGKRGLIDILSLRAKGNVIDVYSRKAFEPVVGFSISGKVVSKHLERLFRLYGAPQIIRRDDGPEFKSKCFQAFMAID
ncbi:hypothetical protein DMNBHIDG_01294 [Candidatus Methanoperedenaceae archaeon GB37]|nr:hypothetical protein DMNBHIDG_01294 [Candidatus Methanoperedenaceae archaeon GB37]